MKLLQDRVVIITGGAAGFGLEAARKFVAHGARVVVADIQEDAGRAIAAEHPDAIRFIRCDVRREADMRAAVDLATSEFGGLDVMYHNAGTVGSPDGIDSISVDDWNASLEMLQTATMLAIKVSAPALKQRGKGSIILTSSGAGVALGGSGPYAYTIAKASVCQIGRYAALKLGRQGTRVNVIVPGAVKTAIWEKHDLGQGQLKADNFSKMQPLPLTGQPHHIADAALFLASDMSEFVSGLVMPVDGGLTLHRNSFASVEG